MRGGFLKNIFCAALVCLVSFISCKSNNFVMIPGEGGVRLKNLSAEYMSIADEYMSLKKYSKAVDYYKEALRVDSYLANSINFKLAKCYALSGDYASAYTLYESLLEQDPQNTTLKVSLAYLCALKGDVDAALEKYDALNAENPTDCDILKNYISLLILKEKFTEAKEKVAFLEENYPDDKDLASIKEKLPQEENTGEASGSTESEKK